MKGLIITIISAMIGAGAAEASNCRNVVRSRVIEERVILRSELATEFVQVRVPAYPVGYGNNNSDFALLIEELRLLRQEVALIRQGQQSRSRSEPDHVALVRKHCIECHSDKPVGKDNKLALFAAGKAWKEPSPELLGDMIAMVATGKMPKNRKMSSEERLALIAGLTTAPPPEAEQLKTPPKEP